MSDVSVLDVLLYDEPIGTLTRFGGDRTLFAFNEAYLNNDQRPVLGLRFKDALGQLITDFKPTQTRLMPYFANLLPEGHMRTYLAERAGVNPNREFFLLWVLGADLSGAMTVRPADGEAWPSVIDDGDDDDDDHRRDHALRFSLAGVQLKFSAVNEASAGLTIPAQGVGGSWIVKLPSREFEAVPENEYSMMRLARMIGMDVPEVKLVDLASIRNLPEGIGSFRGQALAVKRFDRLSDGASIHIEDFAQVFDVYPEDKYKRASYRNIAAVLGAEAGDAGIVEFIRRLTFNMLIGNADMHLKNWSIIYPDRRTVALAPAYDFVATIAYIPDERAALNVSRTKRFDEFDGDELSHLAAKARLPEKLVLSAARETVDAFHQLWHREKKNLPLSRSTVESIERHVNKVPIAR
ncbi:type II toxin-antitoxin system HipA family toxin [Rhizobium etli]|uniref:type II toxin-antitoxin system HipA family toxin n=1 Tax=Rhizobium etli TaxID=29449 RepID=UPI000383A15B|nr:HipA-like domain-containing protein [Rhizobium etli bv. mimosae str. Mim1]